MNTTQVRNEVKQYIDKLSPEKLIVVADFLRDLDDEETIDAAEIKEMIFQLPTQEINQLIKEINETMLTKDFMKLAETGFQEWDDPEEDIYTNNTKN